MQAAERSWTEEQVLHAVHVAALVVVEYVLPAIHAEHWMSEEAVQAALTRAPAEHTEHAAQLGELVAVEYEVPATQGLQVAGAVVVHATATKFPAEQGLQAIAAVTPAGQ